MINKEEFVDILNKLKESQDRTDKICDGLEHLLDGRPIMTVDYPLIKIITDLLEGIFEDTEEWIQYWLWELDYGKAFKMGDVTMDGKDIDISGPDKLYEFLIDNMKEKRQNPNPSDIFENEEDPDELFNTIFGVKGD